MRHFAAIILWFGAVVLPVEAGAGEWRKLAGAEISETLKDRTLVYENATQVFYASGRTLYNAGRDSWGYWRVEEDQYCSQWPPGDFWECYDLEVLANEVRFVSSDGSQSVAHFPQ